MGSTFLALGPMKRLRRHIFEASMFECQLMLTYQNKIHNKINKTQNNHQLSLKTTNTRDTSHNHTKLYLNEITSINQNLLFETIRALSRLQQKDNRESTNTKLNYNNSTKGSSD